MKKDVDPKWFSQVCATLIASDAKSAIKYVDEKTVVKATWRNKPSGRSRSESMVVSFGAPGCREAKFIAMCKKAGEPFPVKNIQLRPYPIKRK